MRINFCLLGILLVESIKCSQQNVRGAWIPVNYYDSTETQIEQFIDKLQKAGINRIYYCVWNQGEVYFNSETYTQLTGKPPKKDSLQWVIKHARKNSMEIYAWFEYGYISAYISIPNHFDSLVRELGWVSETYGVFTWMKPEKATNFLANIMADAAVNYDLDGIQLDDHFACPTKISTCSLELMTQSAQELVAIIKSRTNKVVSLSPSPLNFAYQHGCVDWGTWHQLNVFDEFVPQLYTKDPTLFISALDAHVQQLGDGYTQNVLIGISIDSSSPTLTKWEDFVQMYEAVKTKNVGFVIWYARSITEVYFDEFSKLT